MEAVQSFYEHVLSGRVVVRNYRHPATGPGGWLAIVYYIVGLTSRGRYKIRFSELLRIVHSGRIQSRLKNYLSLLRSHLQLNSRRPQFVDDDVVVLVPV